MSGAYTLSEVMKRLHPRYLFEESRGPGQLVDAFKFWGSQDLGEPDVDVFTGEAYAHHPTTSGTVTHGTSSAI
jgi:hypothetical protein